MIVIPADLVMAAREGDRVALDELVRLAQRPVFNLALRMLADRSAAEDAAQEVLIKIITSLSSLRDPGAAGGWAMRIACRHLVEERKKSRIEDMRMTFSDFAEDLDTGQAPLTKAGLTRTEEAIAIEQVKIGCTMALLTCLSRKLRIAYILGDVFELTDTQAARALEIARPTFRQRLKRARDQVADFTQARCGITSSTARCKCSRRVVPALAAGRITRPGGTDNQDGRVPMDMARLRTRVRLLESGRAAAAELMRSNPQFDMEMASLVDSVLEPIR